MKTALDVLKEWMESTEYYPSHFSVINKIRELKNKEEELLKDAYDAGAIAWSDAVIDKENTKEWSDKYFNDTYKTVSK